MYFRIILITKIQISDMVLTVCPRSSDSFYIVNYYIKWFTTSWTYSTTFPNFKFSRLENQNWKDSCLVMLFEGHILITIIIYFLLKNVEKSNVLGSASFHVHSSRNAVVRDQQIKIYKSTCFTSRMLYPSLSSYFVLRATDYTFFSIKFNVN